MRLQLLAAVTAAAGLSACAPVAPYPYGYTAVETAPAAPYGYYDYGPGPYYAAPYAAPGPTVVIGGERVYRDYDRRPYDGGYRPGYRQYERPRNYERPRDFGGARPIPGPGPGPAPRPAPAPVNIPQPHPPSPGPGGHAPSFDPANPTAQGERG